jgi:hypothetical protein
VLTVQLAPETEIMPCLQSLEGFQKNPLLYAANLAFLDSSDYVPGVQTPERRPAKRELDRCRKFVELLEHPVPGISPLVRTRQAPVHRGRHPVIHR